MDTEKAGIKYTILGALCWIAIGICVVIGCIVALCIKLAEIPSRTQPLRDELAEKLEGLGNFLGVVGYLFVVEPLEHLWKKLQATPEAQHRAALRYFPEAAYEAPPEVKNDFEKYFTGNNVGRA